MSQAQLRASQARMWRELARQCREHNDTRLAEEAEALARRYEQGSRQPPAPRDHAA
jgi:hypothetical protein